MDKPKDGADTRVVYGAMCTWWDGMGAAGTTGDGFPCCPGRHGLLLEVATEEEWWAGVVRHENAGNPGYREFVRWGRGRCHPTVDAAMAAYARGVT